MATLIAARGITHEFPAKRFAADVAEMGMDPVWHDQEPAIKDLVKQIARKGALVGNHQ